MAVYTHIDDAGLNAFLAHYNLKPLDRYEGIAQGVENTNYRLFLTDGTQYILTLYEARIDAADLPFFFAFTNHLAQHGIKAPAVLAGRDGQSVYTLAGKKAALLTWLEGEDVPESRITLSECREAGRLLARMHEAAQSFTQKRKNALGLLEWKKLAYALQDRADEVEPGMAQLIVNEALFLKAHWPDDDALKRGVIHADLFPDNVLFQDGTVSGVIDFYFSCYDFLAYDLALVVNAWCFDERGLDRDRWDALMDGYNRVRPFEGRDYDALPLICRGAALRILLTRLYAWLNHPRDALVRPKDPKEYSAKLRWHQNETIGR